MSKANVIVVGGGIGSDIAKALSQKLDSSKYELILITERPFTVWLPATVRVAVQSEPDLANLENGAIVPFDRLLAPGKGTLKVGKVVSVEPSADSKSGSAGTVVLESGERIPYAALVLATGSRWQDPVQFPSTKEEVDGYVKSWREKFRDAKHVLFVGGGAVGIELAGEVKDIYPNKPVTIVNGSDGLLNPTYPKSFRDRLSNACKARGIEVITNEYVDTIPEDNRSTTGVTTRSGKHIDADLVVSTRGGRPNTEFLAGSGITITEQGRVKAEDTLQAKGFPNIFIAGDILDFDEQKQLAKYAGHAAVIVPNLLAVLAGQAPPKKYKKQAELILVTLGKQDGAAYLGFLWGLQFGGWFARMTKAGDLFVGKHRQGMGY
jgi:NADH dehydrogenase FAD-containing subunit